MDISPSCWVWIAAALLYLGFRLWYDGLRRPLSAEEVNELSAVIDKRAAAGLATQDPEVVKQFMREDDGKEFIMLNLVRLKGSPQEDPVSGEPANAPKLLQAYFKPFMRQMLKRAGHPVGVYRIAGGYLDHWNTAEDPGWHIGGLVRYRSRRDAVLGSLANPAFDELHKYKIAAIEQTFAVPGISQISLYPSPRISVALVLALLASLAQILLNA